MPPERRSPVRHTVHTQDPRYNVPNYNRGSGDRSYWRGKSVVDYPQGILDVGKNLDKLDAEQLSDLSDDVKENIASLEKLRDDLYWSYRRGDPEGMKNYNAAKQGLIDYWRLRDKVEVEKLRRSASMSKVENHTYRADVGHYGGTFVDVPPERMDSFKALFPKGTFPKNITVGERGGRRVMVVKFADRSKGQDVLERINGKSIKLIYPQLDD